jgi:hypothetical protein
MSTYITLSDKIRRILLNGYRDYYTTTYPVFQRSGFDSRLYQILWEVVGLERGPFSLVSTIEELLGRNSSGSDLKIREYERKDPSRWPRDTHLSANVGGGRLVGIVRLRTQATKFQLFFYPVFNSMSLNHLCPCYGYYTAGKYHTLAKY